MQPSLLVVDDEAVVRGHLREYFEGFGYLVREAEDYQGALAALAAEPIQVVFLDLQLKGKSGLTVLKAIRRKGYPCAVFAVTGYWKRFPLEQCKEEGFDDYFVKPVDLSMLHNAALRGFELYRERTQPPA